MRLAPALGAALILLGDVSIAHAGPWREGASGHWAAFKDQEKDNAPLFVYFRTEWCGVCKKFDETALSSAKVTDYLATFAKVRINPEMGKGEEVLAREYGVKGYPGLYIVMPGRKPVSMPIYSDPDAFIAGVQRIVGAPAKKAVVAAATPVPIPPPAPIPVPKSIPRPIAALMEDQKFKQAIELLNDELELNPNKADLFLARGLCHRGMKKHSDAASDFDVYARKKPDDIALRLLLARTYLNLTMYEDAATELESLLEKKPPPEAHWLLGEAKKGLGKPAEATQHYGDACKAGFKPACSAK